MDNEEADKLLDRWGEWSRSNEGNGHSGTNILYRVEKEGAGASHDNVFNGISMADDVAQCERVITQMPIVLKKPVKNKYLYRVPNIEGCKRCNCSEATYKHRIVSAQWFLAGNMMNKIVDFS